MSLALVVSATVAFWVPAAHGEESKSQRAERLAADAWAAYHAEHHLPPSVGIRIDLVDRNGETVRFIQTFNDIPVNGTEGILLLKPSGEVSSWRIKNLLTTEPKVQIVPTISAERAFEIALGQLDRSEETERGLAKLEIYPESWEFSRNRKLRMPALVWTLGIQANLVHTFFIDAPSGEV